MKIKDSQKLERKLRFKQVKHNKDKHDKDRVFNNNGNIYLEEIWTLITRTADVIRHWLEFFVFHMTSIMCQASVDTALHVKVKSEKNARSSFLYAFFNTCLHVFPPLSLNFIKISTTESDLANI